MKGDVRNDKFLIECKTTSKDYYSVTSKVWEKIQKEATSDRMRIPLLVVDLKDGEERYVVFRLKHFNNKLPEPYECGSDKLDQKSYRIKSGELDEFAEDFGEYIYAKVFMICGESRSLLCYMREKDFLETYKEELK